MLIKTEEDYKLNRMIAIIELSMFVVMIVGMKLFFDNIPILFKVFWLLFGIRAGWSLSKWDKSRQKYRRMRDEYNDEKDRNVSSTTR